MLFNDNHRENRSGYGHTDGHAKRQRMLRRYQSLEQGRRKPVAESEMTVVERQLAEANGDKSKVKDLIKAMRDKFEHLDEVLGRVLQLAGDE